MSFTIVGRSYKQETYHLFTRNWLADRAAVAFGGSIQIGNAISFNHLHLSIGHTSHASYPGQMTTRMEDRLDLEHYIGLFVSARGVPPTWFGRRPGGVPAQAPRYLSESLRR